MNRGLIVSVVVVAGWMLLAQVPGSLAFGDEPGMSGSRFDPGRLSFGGRFSESVQQVEADALVPLWTRGASAVFINLRGLFLEDLEQEANVGLVARHRLTDHRLIFGFNTYYDTRWTEQDNTFEQVGAGVEVLSPWVDIRANYYHPLTDARVLSDYIRQKPCCCDGGQTVMAMRMRTYEEALTGYDAEVGVWLPYLSRCMPTALFVGYYDFSSDYADDLSGVRLRAESRVHPNVTLDAEWIEDKDLNRMDYFVGVRIHMPLDFWNGIRFDRGVSAGAGQPFDARIRDPINRDFRIRTLQAGPVVVARIGVLPDTPADPVPVSSKPTNSQVPEAEPPANCYLDENGDVVCN